MITKATADKGHKNSDVKGFNKKTKEQQQKICEIFQTPSKHSNACVCKLLVVIVIQVEIIVIKEGNQVTAGSQRQRKR